MKGTIYLVNIASIIIIIIFILFIFKCLYGFCIKESSKHEKYKVSKEYYEVGMNLTKSIVYIVIAIITFVGALFSIELAITIFLIFVALVEAVDNYIMYLFKSAKDKEKHEDA